MKKKQYCGAATFLGRLRLRKSEISEQTPAPTKLGRFRLQAKIGGFGSATLKTCYGTSLLCSYSWRKCCGSVTFLWIRILIKDRIGLECKKALTKFGKLFFILFFMPGSVSKVRSRYGGVTIFFF